METHKRVEVSACRCEFKSYYVVWKLKNPKIIGATVSLFKSYYVVWKLELSVYSCTRIHWV